MVFGSLRVLVLLLCDLCLRLTLWHAIHVEECINPERGQYYNWTYHPSPQITSISMTVSQPVHTAIAGTDKGAALCPMQEFAGHIGYMKHVKCVCVCVWGGGGGRDRSSTQAALPSQHTEL